MQEFISEKKENVCRACDLDYGQLGCVIETSYQGCILTKTFNNIVAVYDPSDGRGFYRVWGRDCPLKVRILEKGEKVVLSND